MSSFKNILNEYRKNILGEEDIKPDNINPIDNQNTPITQTDTPKDIVDDIEKQSKKPWVDLASILSRAMEYNWSEADIDKINSMLPDGITTTDFINIRQSPKIKDSFGVNIISASIGFFDIIDKIMTDNGRNTIVPAEER